MLTLYKPTLEELEFRRQLMGDEKTMSYNHAYGGTIDFPKERWRGWYEKWIAAGDRAYFYRYLSDGGTFVGETAYHWDGEKGLFLCDLIILARFRGRGYGGQGLDLLCAAAKANGVPALYDDIAADNPSVRLFLKHGFRVEDWTEEITMVKRAL